MQSNALDRSIKTAATYSLVSKAAFQTSNSLKNCLTALSFLKAHKSLSKMYQNKHLVVLIIFFINFDDRKNASWSIIGHIHRIIFLQKRGHLCSLNALSKASSLNRQIQYFVYNSGYLYLLFIN